MSLECNAKYVYLRVQRVKGKQVMETVTTIDENNFIRVIVLTQRCILNRLEMEENGGIETRKRNTKLLSIN